MKIKHICSFLALCCAILILSGCSNSTTQQECVFPRGSNKLANDKVFHNFVEKCNRTIGKINNVKRAKKMSWMKILYAEGYPFFALDYRYLKLRYGMNLSEAYNIWLDHLDKTEQIVEDATLCISSDELREYIVFLENFIKQNKNFVAIADVAKTLGMYLYINCNGIDNTRVSDRVKGERIKEFSESYKKFCLKIYKTAVSP